MSQNKLENDSTGAVPVRIALQPDAAPANDIDCGRIGPLGLSRTYWMLWSGMLLNRLGGTIFLLLGLYLTRERGLTPELAGLIISLYAAGGLLAGPIGGTSADRFGRRPVPAGGDGRLGGVHAGARLRALDGRDRRHRAGAGVLHRRLSRAAAGGGGRRRAAARPGPGLWPPLLGDEPGLRGGSFVRRRARRASLRSAVRHRRAHHLRLRRLRAVRRAGDPASAPSGSRAAPAPAKDARPAVARRCAS